MSAVAATSSTGPARRPKRLVFDLSPPQAVVNFTLSPSATPPFELTFHTSEPIEPPDDKTRWPPPAVHAESEEEKAAQRQWLIDTHRIWRSIAETAEAERRDERWVVPYDAIVSNNTAASKASGIGRISRTADGMNKRSKVSHGDAEHGGTDATESTAATLTSLPAAFMPLISHFTFTSTSTTGWQPWFRPSFEAAQRLRAFDSGFFGRFINRIQQHNSDTKEEDERLHVMIGGSAPLAATCRIGEFEPNDIDLYMKHISNIAVRALHRVIQSLIDPTEQAIVLLRKPLTLTWAIYQRQWQSGDPLTILHKVQLNLLFVHSWAEVFAVYHGDLVCAGFDVVQDRFVVLYDRWRRFYDTLLAPPTQPTGAAAWDAYEQHRRWGDDRDHPAPAHQPLYFSSFLNLDTTNTLASAAYKYRKRGFAAVGIDVRDAQLQPAANTQWQEREVQHLLASELSMSQMARGYGSMAGGVKLWPIPICSEHGTVQCLSRNDVVGWLFGLCLSRLYKVAVSISDVLMPDAAGQAPSLLYIRWLASFIANRNSSVSGTSTAQQPNIHSSADGKEEKSDTVEFESSDVEADGFGISAQLALLGLTASDVPWQLADEFEGRFGGAFVLSPLLLSLADCEYCHVFDLRRMIAAAYGASVTKSKRTAVAALNRWIQPSNRCIRPDHYMSDDDENELSSPPDDMEYLISLHSDGIHTDDFMDDQFVDVQFDKDMSGAEYRDIVERLRHHERPSRDVEAEIDNIEMRRHERDCATPAPLNTVFRYGLIQITRALLGNGEISHDQVAMHYPWVIRFFQAKYIRNRRAVKQLLTHDETVTPLLPELMLLVVDYV